MERHARGLLRIMVDAVGKVRPIFDGSVPRFASSPSAWPGFVMEEYEVPAGEFPRRVVFRDHIFGTFEGEKPVTQYWRDGKFERHHKIRRGDVTLRSNQELIGCRWDYAARIVVLAVPHATLADIFAVTEDTFNTSAVSSMLSPPKKRISMI